ncbi:MAG: nitroreductase family protein [candidate division KSB1 bacterium]|nr:nitroreductase family protein [candidate division KSB1 bacterium]MDZ7411970.1 nitroreductase family protein [candidate division KSB1 bacterium]
MEFSQLVRARYSVRAYKSVPVEEEKLAAILEAARLAPTAANRQPFAVVVVKTREREEELHRIYKAPWFTQAPLVIAMCTVPDKAWTRRDGKNYADVDATIAMDHLVLAAADLGLGTCWVAAFDPVAAREVLRLPEGVEPLAFTPLGYPDDRPGPKSRKPLSELVHYERW